MPHRANNVLVFSPDGSLLGSSNEDDTARIWDVGLEKRNLDEIKRLIGSY
jgi:WD40 repeat protein